ncbi:alanine racemase [Gordonia jinhuaensis]|uniref:D-serine dehydratase-like domain-containing protein n=2 Tax=Gordonia jinhuaensis TaxID=1517702 RepID=A0A916TGR2_9ACTN|nr:hypothetical protein GCM10011489_33250 [Gordonia jinhuaensis]
MAPELIRRQLAAGAWGMTASTVRHAEVAFAAGARRLILAHQIVDTAQLEALSRLADSGAQIAVFVDSSAGLDILAPYARRSPSITVLAEMGIAGGRTGVRSAQALYELLDHIHSRDITLSGVSAYEGLLPAIRRPLPPAYGAIPPTTEAVTEFVSSLADAITGAIDRGLLAADAIITAGGSSAFDIVADRLSGVAGAVILRSGCYVTHDDGAYVYVSPLQEGNSPNLTPAGTLQPALRLWASVVSAPEPGKVIVNIGHRDFGDDIGSPELLARATGGEVVPASGWTVAQTWDQHVRLDSSGQATGLHVGDVVLFGISHPCTTFDKWRVLLEIDDDHTVVDVIETRF